LEIFVADTEVEKLANLYISEKAVSGKFFEDALHIQLRQ
jgi:hypothetical protein